MVIIWCFFLPMLLAIGLYSGPMFNNPTTDRGILAKISRISGAVVAIIAGVVSILVSYMKLDMSLLWSMVFLPSVLVGILLIFVEIGLIGRSDTRSDDLSAEHDEDE